MSGTCKYLVLGSAMALFALPALAAEETPSAPVVAAAAPTAIVKCPGVTSIPFTADAEQALPMKIVGSLTCGDTVAVISDLEGYTAQIRTRDGHQGYVARMYLAEGHASTPAVQKPQASSATPVNGVVRWASGAPGCDEFISHGRHVESITANGVTVQVSIQDSGWKYRTNMAVSNQSSEKVLVLPGIITLDELRPNLHSLLAADPARLAHNTTHQIFWTLTTSCPHPAPLPPIILRPPNPILATALPPRQIISALIWRSLPPTTAVSNANNPSTFSPSPSKPAVPAGQMTAGVMWFNRDSAAHDLSMRVPVGNMVFDFAFSLEQKKQ